MTVSMSCPLCHGSSRLPLKIWEARVANPKASFVSIYDRRFACQICDSGLIDRTHLKYSIADWNWRTGKPF